MGSSWRLRQGVGWPAVVAAGADVVVDAGDEGRILVGGRIRRASTWADDDP